ncbi:MAG TPA: hypothetical protein VGE53_01220 [Candidatus Paceibacterota bacterium]
MNRILVLLFALAILGIGGAAAWYLVNSRNDAFGPTPEVVLPEPNENLAIYTNGPYGFTLFYPEAADVSYEFDPTYHLGSAWRANALPDVPGDPLVSIVPYAVSSENSYPRYFNAMVRVGASADPQEVERCEKVGVNEGETALSDRTINGRVWKAFSFESAGMMQYARGISYRTIHEDVCIALEQVRTGSSYREDAPSERDIAEATLDAEFENLDAIVASFVFVR